MWGLAACYALIGIGWFAAAATPDGLGAAAAFIAGGVLGLVFGILALLLVFRYLNALNQAARRAKTTWALDATPTRDTHRQP